MTRLLNRVAGWLGKACSSSGELDLAEFPELLDETKVATFYEACLEVYPGLRDIYLPSALADRLLKSQPPVKAELLLTERLYQDHPSSLAICLPRGSSAASCPSIVLHFVGA
jgi:hypothetical protein